MIVHQLILNELQTRDALDTLENANAQVTTRVWHRDNRGIGLMLEMMVAALDPHQRPTSHLERLDDLARASH